MASPKLPLIRASQLLPFADMLHSHCLDPKRVLSACYLPSSADLNNPAVVISTGLAWKFVEECATQLRDINSGWNTAMRYGLLGGGALGYQLENQPCLGDALKLYTDKISLHANVSIGKLSESRGVIFFRRSTFPKKGSSFWQVEQYALGTMLHIVRSYLGASWKPHCIRVAANLTNLQGSAMSEACNILIGDNDVAGIEVPTKLLGSKPRPMTNSLKDPGPKAPPFPDTFPEALHAMLLSYVSEYPLTNENVARITDLHPRTLNRRLAEYGVSFRTVQQNVILQYSKQVLEETPISVSELARSLGYANHSAFTRAFARMAGYSPQRYREKKTKI